MTSYSVKNPTIRPTPRSQTQAADSRQQATPPRWTSRLRSAVRAAIYGFDAAALITHGATVPPNHPARNPSAGHTFDITDGPIGGHPPTR